MVDLSAEVAGIRLKNPVMPASGCFSYGREMARWYDLSRLGAIVVKGTTLEAMPGNPPPRVAETPAGMLNAIGLQNPGVDRVIAEELPALRPYGVPVIVNVAGSTVEEYVEVARRLAASPDVAALELNISCPNVRCGGMHFGTDPAMAAEVTSAVKAVSRHPVFVKLSPNVTDVVALARAVERAGADGLSMINTLVGMRIDPERRRPVLANGFGGLSGPAVKPVALRMVYEVSQAVRLPVIGMGGIAGGEDAVEFLMAGASAVAVGTANFMNPTACVDIIEELTDWCRRHGVRAVRELIGAAWRAK
ncbi:MAG: dihydroorotate dehydrogenase [Kyrpidia sp.]|nr:dihydroorotate dehydrogenase [Kyrpidia sp.]